MKTHTNLWRERAATIDPHDAEAVCDLRDDVESYAWIILSRAWEGAPGSVAAMRQDGDTDFDDARSRWTGFVTSRLLHRPAVLSDGCGG